MKRVIAFIEILLLSAWAGGAWFAGLFVAPRLFESFPTETAGDIAGLMFNTVFWISLPAIGLSLLTVLLGRTGSRSRLDVALLSLAAGVSLIGELVLHPWIVMMREQSDSRDFWFAAAHGASSLLFLINCVLAAVILLRRCADAVDRVRAG